MYLMTVIFGRGSDGYGILLCIVIVVCKMIFVTLETEWYDAHWL